jgi:dCTP deaminase
MQAILSDLEIEKSIARGTVVINPFYKDQLSTSSYDVTLGKYFARVNPTFISKLTKTFNPWHKFDLENFWGQIEEGEVIKDPVRAAELGCLLEDRIIIIYPGETILAHTNEFIGGRETVTTMMKARSSIGRSQITICKCAGYGDIGYINRWTLECSNNGPLPVVMIVGQRVAQIIFFHTASASRNYESKGSYQVGSDIATIIAGWSPEQIKPKISREPNRCYEDQHSIELS